MTEATLRRPLPVLRGRLLRLLALAVLAPLLACAHGATLTTAPRTASTETFDGNRIHYTVHGSGEPTVVLIHGWSCDRSYWREQVPALARDHTVVALDLPGHGASTAQREGWTMPAFGRDVAAVIEHLGLERVVLVGHSMGGEVSLEAAARLPQRVLGVVGVDTLHDVEYDWSDYFDRLLPAFHEDFSGTCRGFVASMFTAEAEPRLREWIIDDMCSAPPEVALELLSSFRGYDLGASLQAAGVPVRTINAAGFPTAVDTNRRYGDFEAVVIEDVGHFLQLEAPERVNAELLRIVRELSSPG